MPVPPADHCGRGLVRAPPRGHPRPSAPTRLALVAAIRRPLLHLQASWRIALYAALPWELDAAPLIAAARRERGCRIYLPRIGRPRATRAMRFVRAAPARSAPQPPRDRRARPDSELVGARWLDVVFLPLVGFDRSGCAWAPAAATTIAPSPSGTRRHAWHGPRLIGLAYAFQEVDAHRPRTPMTCRWMPSSPRKGSSDASLADEDRTVDLRRRRSRRGAAAHHRLGRCAQLPGAQHAARRDAASGDQAFLYHSSCEVPGIVAIMQIVKHGYPDPTAFDRKDDHYDPDSDPKNPRWFMVDVQLKRRSRASSRSMSCARTPHKELKGMVLLRPGNRLVDDTGRGGSLEVHSRARVMHAMVLGATHHTHAHLSHSRCMRL